MNRIVAIASVAALAATVLLAGCAKPPKPPVATQAAEPGNITEGVAVSASDWEQKAKGGWNDFPPEKTLDGDLSKLSSWRAEAEDSEHGQWIRYDLGQVRTVALVKLAFLQGDARIYRFEIELSSDGQDWTKVFAGESRGQADFQTFDFDDQPAQYVRVTGYGNRSVEGENKFPKWINIVETQIHGS